MPCPSYSPSFDHSNNIWWRYKLWSSSLYSCLELPFISYLFPRPSSALCSQNALSLLFLRAIDQRQAHTKLQLFVLIFTFLYNIRGEDKPLWTELYTLLISSWMPIWVVTVNLIYTWIFPKMSLCYGFSWSLVTEQRILTEFSLVFFVPILYSLNTFDSYLCTYFSCS
jgi:hypothetical protein